jgi:Holliday junction DNA helicase RuvA
LAQLGRTGRREAGNVIGRLSGVLLAKEPPSVLLDVNGVAYEVDVPMSSFYNLPAVGERTVLLTHLQVREDVQQLFGFGTAAERDAFRQLLKISGIGARTALSVLSGMSVDELAQAVAAQDAARLTRVPGIGKKTAERLLLELKDKLEPALATRTSTAQDGAADIVRALVALGYSEREASSLAKAVPAGTPVAEGIRLALKSVARG